MNIHPIGGQGFSGNIFLIDARKPCLVDAGWDPNITLGARQVSKVLGERPLEHIVLTHRHIDHVGGAMAFHREFGGEMLAHEDDADALIEGDAVSTGAMMFGGNIEPMPVRKLKDGDTIDLGDGESLLVVHTPGHSIGSMCLLGRENLLSGDTVFADGGVGRWDLETGNYDQLLASLEKIAGLDFENMYPGHGPSVMGVAKEHVAISLKHLRLLGRFG
ncbi:MAG: MBL fold metallo-hydrolase [Thermoplasmata archaeon]